MALATGTRFGAYEITGALGAGGMGEVYRAVDTQLKRDVAVKVLPPSFADDADRLARFQREAEVLASLNHPNIAQVYGLEKFAGARALILELVEGPTLAERLEQGPIPPDEALAIARQIAEALEAAHGRGIVHRDLKPANIKLRPDGTVKVLDFGIAKAIETRASSGPQAPSLTTPAMTRAGILLGTAAYMAPEQARGKQVDQRADIWAFGCVLYEMLTGQPAFGGEDVPMTLARVLANDTDLKTMPAAISPAVRHTIKLCLEKDVRKRIADIRDVKLALAGTFDTGLPLAGGAGSARRRSLVALWLPLAAAALAILALVAWLSTPPRTPAALPELRLAANLPASITDASDFGPRPGDFALSPDGRYVVLDTSGTATGGAGASQLWLWRLDSGEARPLAGAERARRPFWSADGRSVLFSTDDGALKKADIVGGPAQTVVPTGVAGLGRGGGSSRGDVVVFGNGALGFSIVTSTGGTQSVTEIADAREHQELPALLPDGKRFLYFRHTFRPETQGIYLASVDSEPAKQPSAPVVLADDGPVLVEDADTGSRYLLFMRERTLLAQGFDVDSGAVHGEPVVVATNVEGGGGQGWYSASADGRLLVFREGAYESLVDALKSLVWVDREGEETAVPIPPRAYNRASLSPDGRHIALVATDRAIWIWDVERESLTRLPSTHESVQGVVWTPDSRRVAFRDANNEALWQPADGASDAESLGFIGIPWAFTADGRMLYGTPSPLNQADVSIRSIANAADAPTPLLTSTANERNAQLSPDGRFIAYESDESGRAEIYVRPFPDAATARWPISTNGGKTPLWSTDGRELYYYEGSNPAGNDFAGGALMAVSIELEPDFRPGAPQQLFAGDYVATGSGRHYDVAPGGQRFLMIKLVGEVQRSRPELIFAQNWLAAVKRRLGESESSR